MELTRIKRVSLSEQVLNSIVEYIGKNSLKVGDRLPTEGEFSAMLGVSRASVREALKSLCISGALESTPGRGTFIRADFSEGIPSKPQAAGSILAAKASVKEIMEVRTALELLAFDLALDREVDDEIESLSKAMNELRNDVSQGKSWAQSGSRFHMCIAEMSGNKLLVDTIRSLAATVNGYKIAMERSETVMVSHVAEHEKILDCLKRRDRAAGHRAIITHMANTERDISSLIDADTAETFVEIGSHK